MILQWNDALNALVEGVGGAFVWWNVWRLYKDKTLKGVAWQTEAYGMGWNAWHLVYYTSLTQWLSFMGELFGSAAVLTWLALAWRYRTRSSAPP